MFPYLLTFMCLFGMCLISSTESRRFYNQSLLNELAKEEDNILHQVKSLNAQAHYFDYIGTYEQEEGENSVLLVSKKPKENRETSKTGKKRNRSLRIDCSRPPDNSRINLCAVFLETETDRKNSFSWFSILSRLIISEYLDKDAFKDYTVEDVHRLLQLIIEEKEILIALAEQNPSPDILAQLSCEDKKLSGLLYRLLSGGENFSSLLCFIDYIPKRSLGFCKLNFLFLDRCILKAIFSETTVIEILEKIRQNVFCDVLEKESDFQEKKNNIFKTRTDFKEELKRLVTLALLEHGLNACLEKNFFDFSLGKSGNYILMKNIQDHCITRFRYTNTLDKS